MPVGRVETGIIKPNSNKPFTGLQDFTDKDFFDVTLACGDEQYKAHKVIFSASSPFFKSILCRNRHQHLLLYLNFMPTSGVQNSTAQIIDPGDATIIILVPSKATCVEPCAELPHLKGLQLF